MNPFVRSAFEANWNTDACLKFPSPRYPHLPTIISGYFPPVENIAQSSIREMPNRFAHFLRQQAWRLSYILLTHHHADHTGGVAELAAKPGGTGIRSSRQPHTRPQDQSFGEGDTVALPLLNLEFQVIEVPGHTSTHIAFYGHGGLFCGDTLFSVGCGRLFEGTPAQMQDSLDRLAALPRNTSFLCT